MQMQNKGQHMAIERTKKISSTRKLKKNVIEKYNRLRLSFCLLIFYIYQLEIFLVYSSDSAQLMLTLPGKMKSKTAQIQPRYKHNTRYIYFSNVILYSIYLRGSRNGVIFYV